MKILLVGNEGMAIRCYCKCLKKFGYVQWISY